jgi:hypothetical protein
MAGVNWLFSQTGSADAFTIQISTNRTTWTTIKSGTNASANTWQTVTKSASARYVRFYFTNPNRDTVVGYLAEVEIWGTTTSSAAVAEATPTTAAVPTATPTSTPEPTAESPTPTDTPTPVPSTEIPTETPAPPAPTETPAPPPTETPAPLPTDTPAPPPDTPTPEPPAPDAQDNPVPTAEG